MPYVSYPSVKIVHDQKIQEALERQRLYAGQETQMPGLLQTFGKFLARFTNRPGRKQEGAPSWLCLVSVMHSFLLSVLLRRPGRGP